MCFGIIASDGELISGSRILSRRFSSDGRHNVLAAAAAAAAAAEDTEDRVHENEFLGRAVAA